MKSNDELQNLFEYLFILYESKEEDIKKTEQDRNLIRRYMEIASISELIE